MPCFRVAVRVYRLRPLGRIVIVEREGPVITAPSAEEARRRALAIFTGRPDFAELGEATLLHESHRGLRLRPIPPSPDDLTLSLAAMVRQIREGSQGR